MTYDPQNPDIRADGKRIPTLFGYRFPNGDLRIWCMFCAKWHIHGNLTPDQPIGAADGHRVCHCAIDDSPYADGGYFIVELDSPIPEPAHVIKPRYLRGGGYVSGFLIALRKARGIR